VAIGASTGRRMVSSRDSIQPRDNGPDASPPIAHTPATAPVET
jgi:hypothetical protein